MRYRLLLCVATCLSLAASFAADQPEQMHHYELTLDAGLQRLKVRVCFDGATPVTLIASHDKAPNYLRSATWEVSGKPVTMRRQRMLLSGAPDDSCLRYQVDLTDESGEFDEFAMQRSGSDILTSAGIWFWRPKRLAENENMHLHFELPKGVAMSAPWEPIEQSNVDYLVGHNPMSWPTAVAFGRFEIVPINVAGAQLRLTVLAADEPVDIEAMQLWLSHAAQAVSRVYGEFPLKKAQLMVIPRRNDSSRGPVPWAMVLRGGNPAALFFTNPEFELSDYEQDWTATHELSHMLLPYVDRRDSWLSEGFASYYQNVLMARQGLYSTEQAWSKLDAGLRRGERAENALSLAQHGNESSGRASTMRIYWSGAAIALLADVALRQRDDGQSLDSVLAQLKNCCLPSEKTWRARALFAKLDALSDSHIFTDLYLQHVHASEFPDVSEVYLSLGLARNGDALSYSEQQQNSLRQQIMQP